MPSFPSLKFFTDTKMHSIKLPGKRFIQKILVFKGQRLLRNNRAPKCDITKILFSEYFNFGSKPSIKNLLLPCGQEKDGQMWKNWPQAIKMKEVAIFTQ